MAFRNFLIAVPLAAFVSCSDSSEVIPVTYGEYELTCVESVSKKDMTDTLFLSPLAGVTQYDVCIRRKVLTGEAFEGEYEYVVPSAVRLADGSDKFSVSFTPAMNGRVSGLALSATANMDIYNPILSRMTFSVPGTELSMPIKQHKAELIIDDDYFVMHPDMESKELYLDNKGDTIDFKCALASSYYVNGVKSTDLWCNENCTFDYELEVNDWIKVLECIPDKEVAGLFNLRIESVEDPDRGDHPASLSLRFSLDGKPYEKKVHLLSTEVFHIDWN